MKRVRIFSVPLSPRLMSCSNRHDTAGGHGNDYSDLELENGLNRWQVEHVNTIYYLILEIKALGGVNHFGNG